jgi:hypothetical protein
VSMLATAGNRLCVSSSRSVAVWAACPVGRPYKAQHSRCRWCFGGRLYQACQPAHHLKTAKKVPAVCA